MESGEIGAHGAFVNGPHGDSLGGFRKQREALGISASAM
jgi:hypothetical protein